MAKRRSTSLDPRPDSSMATPDAWTRASAEVDQHLHHGTTRERFLHAFLEILERDAAAHEGTDRNGARRCQADGLLPVGSRVEAAAVHGELPSEHGIEAVSYT